MIVVCPLPSIWNDIYKKLLDKWKESGSVDAGPPAPLILNGWVYSNDRQKMLRWESTKEWAKARGYSAITDNISGEFLYHIDELNDYDIGPMGEAMYLPWLYESKPIPSKQELSKALGILSQNWGIIFDPNLSDSTIPIRFTGKKGRRLLVKVVKSIDPPWGTWDSLSHEEEKRRHFTKFRSKINELIKPHMVDHIDFEI